MKTIVDVELKKSAMDLILRHLIEEESKNKRKMKECDIEEGIQRYLTIFQEVIQKRLDELSNQKADFDLVNSPNILLEEQKTLEIGDPPTETQLLIIKSFLKVVYHHFYTKRDEFYSNEGNHNLLFSIFINKITVEESIGNIQDQDGFIEFNSSLESTIVALFKDTNKTPGVVEQSSGTTFKYNFYVLPEMEYFPVSNSFLTEDFTKLDFEDQNINKKFTSNINNIENSTFLTEATDITQQFSFDSLKHITLTKLPCHKFEGLWENLFFENDTKRKIFNYGEFSMEINNHLKSRCHKKKSSYILVNNKTILLHGPPGTGKTTLCQGLAQKLTIRKKHATVVDSISSKPKGLLIEMSCSRMFSRWFGESAKNLECIFNDLRNTLSSPEYQKYFVLLLIDEIETIAGSRKDILSKNESSDSIRVVNTLLTQIDSLKFHNNFLILTTSNLVECLDPAFLDRVDEIFFIEVPSVKSITNILISIVNSLLDTEIIYLKNHNKTCKEKEYLKIIDILAQECVVCVEVFYRNVFFALLKKR